MSESLSARGLFERFQQCALRKDWRAFGDLFAEDGTMEFPFVSPDVAHRYQGREAIRARAREAWGGSPLQPEEFASVVVEEGVDPSVLFAEYDLRGTVVDSDESFRVSAAVVLRSRDGLIVSLREYVDPLAMVRATGRAAATASLLAQPDPMPLRAEAGGEIQASQALVERYFEMWNTGDWAVADVVLGPTYLDHAYPGVMGPAAVRSLVRRFRSGNPEARMLAEVVASGVEHVVVRRSIRWTRDSEPEPGGMALIRIAGGRLAEQWSWSSTGAAHAGGAGAREVWTEAHRDARAYGTGDPEVIVVELDLHGAGGGARRLSYVQIVRVRDGRIVVLGDYFDSQATAAPGPLGPAPTTAHALPSASAGHTRRR